MKVKKNSMKGVLRMAEGIPFVPLECQLNEKFEYIEAEFGLQGFAIVVKLFQRIYGQHGYYCDWNDRVALLFAKQISAGRNVVCEVVSAALRERIFDMDIYKRYGVLTSKGIQKRFADVAKRRKQVFAKPEYVLLSCADFPDIPELADISTENACNPTQNACNSPTSNEIKETKENLSNAKQEASADASAASAACRSKKELIDKYGSDMVEEYEARFDKWQTKQGKVRVNKYDTIAKWLEEDAPQAKPQPQSQPKPQYQSPYPHKPYNQHVDVDEIMEEILSKYR